MPEWMHERAEHILAKNPSMPKSEAFAIATQQMHALGKSPKGYGTAEGRATAKAKYDTPKDDKKTANPGGLSSSKMEKKSMDQVMASAFLDELTKIAEDGKKHKKHEAPGMGKTIAALLLGGPGAAFGLHKGAPHGEAFLGALRGGVGAAGGGTVGSLAGHALGSALGGPASAAVPIGQTLGGIAGQLGGYKLLTHKYDEA